MCLAVPMRIIALTDDGFARCDAHGAEQTVSLAALMGTTVAAGDFIIAHVGFAVARIAQDQALAVWALLDDLASPPGTEGGKQTCAVPVDAAMAPPTATPLRPISPGP